MVGLTQAEDAAADLRCAVVLRVAEDACELHTGQEAVRTRFAATVPAPRTERVRPGHLVAVATRAGDSAVVWRWFDAVVLGPEEAGAVRLWEPAHGEVVARLREPAQPVPPGSRLYASSGLPGADWWAAGPVVTDPADAVVELDALRAFYDRHDLWERAFGG